MEIKSVRALRYIVPIVLLYGAAAWAGGFEPPVLIYCGVGVSIYVAVIIYGAIRGR